MKKYELTNETVKMGNITLYRIKRLSDGLLGGYVESEKNLSQDGSCFIYENARVFRNALVSGDAKVYGNAQVFNHAQVSGNALVSGYATVYGNAQVSHNAQVFEHAKVYENALVSGDAKVYGNALVYGNAQVCGDAQVCDNAQVCGKARVSGDALVCGRARVFGDALVENRNECVFIQAHPHSITITKNHIALDCEQYTIEHWRKNTKQIGLKHDYSQEQIKAVIYLLKGALLNRKLAS